jgi:prefoldin subunit 2
MMEETKETKTTEKAPEVTKEVQMTINDIIAKYRQIQNDYNILLERYVEISEEKREYELVNDAIKGLDGERKCWRMIGGLLVEKNVKVVLPELAVQIENMKKIIASLEDSITRKAQEMKAHETK